MRLFLLFHDSHDDYGIDKLPGLFIKPILNCGLDIEVHMLIRKPENLRAYPRYYDERMLREFREFKPDILVYSPWETIPQPLFDEAHRLEVPIMALYWDTRTQLGRFELDIFEHCNYVAVADSLATYYRLSLLNQLMHRHEHSYNTIFCSGYLIERANYPKLELPKTYDVLLLGSMEASRIELVAQLKAQLAEKNIGFEQLGGIIAGSKNLSPQEYIECVNSARILICSQTQPARVQIKNKVYEFLSCGAFCMVDRNVEYESVIPDDCVVYYDDFDDLLHKIEYYMEHPEERETIALRGHEWYAQTYDIPAFWARTLNAIVAHRGDTLPAPSVLYRDHTSMAENNPCYRMIERETFTALEGFGFGTPRKMSPEGLGRLISDIPDIEPSLAAAGYRKVEGLRMREHAKWMIVKASPTLEKLPFGLFARARQLYRLVRRLRQPS